jgi:serine/threonine-protein kinase RsbW
VLHAVEPGGLTAEQRDNLAVAVAEALSNAAVHGNKLRAGSSVGVTVTVTAESVAVEVRDEGPGFDAGGVADPTEPGRLLVPGGRGVFLMRRLVDDVRFNERGNTVVLVVRRPDAP